MQQSPYLNSASAGVPPWRPEALSVRGARDTCGRAGAADSTASDVGNAHRLSWGSCGFRARVRDHLRTGTTAETRDGTWTALGSDIVRGRVSRPYRIPRICFQMLDADEYELVDTLHSQGLGLGRSNALAARSHRQALGCRQSLRRQRQGPRPRQSAATPRTPGGRRRRRAPCAPGTARCASRPRSTLSSARSPAQN